MISFSKDPHNAQKVAKVFAIMLFICATFTLYIFRLFYMQVIEGYKYRSQSQRISSQTRTIAAKRGDIYDRDAVMPLVVNNDSFAVDLIPGEIPIGLYDTVAAKLATFLNMSKLDIDKKVPSSIRHSYTTVEIKTNVSFNDISNIAENITDLPGVSWRSRPVRNYVGTPSLSHILGYVGTITKEEMNMMYNSGYKTANAIIGKTGIEKQYDSLLQGVPGYESRVVDARGRVVSDKPIIEPPQMGKKLVLTIDSRIQQLVEKTLGERVGAAVVLRPSNGEVLAMVSYPYFDANIFNSDSSSQEYQKLLNNPNKPLVNRAVNSVYPPASTFKTIMTTAILAEDAFPAEKKVDCKGKIIYGDRIFRCHIREPGHGWLDLKNGLAQSCDVYYWQVGRDYLGVDKIASYASEFGFGQSLKIDLPAQLEGFVPTPQWKERRFHEKWLGGDTMNMSIGQGFTLATPMHVADMMAMVCNNGTIYRPHLLKEVRDSVTDKILQAPTPEVLCSSNIDPKVWQQVQEDLRYTVTNGTVQYPLGNRHIQIAGKSGTAEVAQFKKQWHSWFVAYAPYDAPVEEQVVVCVLVEAINKWEWWAPYATNIIIQGIFANQTFEEAVETLGFKYLTVSHSRQE